MSKESAEVVLTRVVTLLSKLPVQQGASDKEPWVTINIVDITALVDVAEGRSNPDDWVSEFCHRDFDHSAHHWSEYRDGQDPLRITHYCNGELIAPTASSITN